MHRSGTSMIARALNLAGVYLGPEQDLHRAASDNPDGFWENHHFVTLNDQILSLFNGAWDTPPALQAGWEENPDLHLYRLKAAEIIGQFRNQKHWGWKDPRSSLTIDFWKRLLPKLKVVICVRNPIEVAESLSRRGYSSNKFSFNLWEVYNNHILSAIPTHDRIVTHFDSFFTDPRSELIRLLDFLEITPSNDELDSALSTINIASRHNQASLDDLLEKSTSYELLELYQSICLQAGPIHEAASGGDLFFSREDYINYKENQPQVIFKELTQKILDLKKQLVEVEKQLVEKEKLIQSLSTQLAEKQQTVETTIQTHKADISNRDQAIDSLNTELQEIKRGITWKIYRLIVRIRLALIPPGSNRERFIHYIIKTDKKSDIKNNDMEAPYPVNASRSNILKTISLVISTDGIKGVWIRIKNKFIRLFRLIKGDQRSSGKYIDVYLKYVGTSLNSEKSEYVPISNDDYNGNAPVKLIAYYLPQFHPIPENDEWWGKGFTEWANVSKASPQFLGHYQPRLPGELGFYDLRIPAVQHRQIELAQKYGIHGFCFYYYWFDGKRLLEYPLEQFINDPTINFPFCLCWANENWTRRWDGQENELLMDQKHSPEGDIRFIKDIAPILAHKNYIRINGRPVLIVYRANVLPDPEGTAKRWKEYCKSISVDEPYLIAAQTFFFEDPTKIGFDAAVQFPPHSKSQIDISDKLQILNPNYKGNVVDYKDAWPKFGDFSKKTIYKLFHTVFPSWDNESRKPEQGYTFANSTPNEYQAWLETAIKATLDNTNMDERIVFINAWNEWAEGAYLEPDRKFGYAYLQATMEALKSAEQLEEPQNEFDTYG
jgi:hypothetical protein